MCRSLCLACLLLVVLGDCAANTRFGYGTIIAVDFTGDNSRKGQPSFTIAYEFKNLKWSTLYPFETFRIHERTRHGPRVYLLDGQASTAEEALQVGRAICLSDNDMVCQIATTPGPWPIGAEPDPATAIYRLELRGGFSAMLAKIDRGKQREPEQETSNIQVVLDVAQGTVTAATAIISGLRGQTDIHLDPAMWQVADGAVTGQLRCSVAFTEDSKYVTPDRSPLAIDLTVTSDADLEGSYTGTVAGAERSDRVSGNRLAAVTPITDGRIWLQFDELEGNKCTFGVLSLTAGRPADGSLIYFKGSRIGDLGGSGLQTTPQGGFSGPLSITSDKLGGERIATVAVDCYGGRLLLGTYTLAAADGAEPVTRALRGGLIPGPIGQPPIEGTHGDLKALVKQIQAEMESAGDKD